MSLKKQWLFNWFLVLTMVVGSLAAALPVFGQSQTAGDVPNILIFVADDAGWRDFGIYGNEVIQTPNVDRLAADGLQFEQAFLTTAQCSPSRISILTGLYPHATGAEDLHMPLPEGTRILPDYLAERGYFTGHMKKTHYGPHADAQFDWYSEKLSDEFPSFLEQAGEKQFFLWVGFSDPHRPYGKAPVRHRPGEVKVPPYLVDSPETRADIAQYYDEISRMDDQIGLFIEELERRDQLGNTLIIFLSDNGSPFPRAKGTVYDEGVRTPLIFHWPEQIEAGSRYEGLTSVIDLTPTLLDLVNYPAPDTMQGQSILDVLSDQTLPGREYVYSERNWHDTDEHIRSLRTERFKLIQNAYVELPHGTPADIGGSPSFRSLIAHKKEGTLNKAQSQLFEAPRPRIELYDLKQDPWELNNVAAGSAHWQRARELAQQLNDWRERTGDFPPYLRVRDDHTDRATGVWFSREIPPMRNLRKSHQY
ncbi:sulfatase family protein [Fodinibius sediminis]|uniref:Arylsulfatase A n=1 Tax=Fodinibius sediminis TaxID=1214077 RepID=A0A521DPS2_9BACT|nr:sulfatase [Fodinibius sediminis]SMO73704.1 Arylsulfatase A [Fodinibius sediminis]